MEIFTLNFTSMWPSVPQLEACREETDKRLLKIRESYFMPVIERAEWLTVTIRHFYYQR